MCFNTSVPELPPPPPLAPAPAAPTPPSEPAAAPEALQSNNYTPGVKSAKSRRSKAGLTNQGTSSLRINLNTGSSGSSSGGLNL